MHINVIYNRFKTVGLAAVHLDVYFNRRERLYVHTGVKVESKDWDYKKNRVKKSNSRFIGLNLRITQLIEKIEQFETDCYKRKIPFTKDTLRAHLDGKDQEMKLVKLVKDMFKGEAANLAPDTIRLYNSVIKNLENFEDTPLADINDDWLQRYHEHLLKTMKSTSTSKNHKMIKRALVRAEKEGLIERNPYDFFRIPEPLRKLVFLDTAEIERLRKYKGLSRLEKTRDMFLFQCLTGMSYRDMQELKLVDLQKKGERYYIIKPRGKTKGMQIIPIMQEAYDIALKHNEGEKVFPNLTNQRMNGYLKEIATICGINKTLTTHLGRHTFATLMLGKGLPMETVSHILGHSSTRITEVYAKVVFEKVEKDFNRLEINSL